MTWWKNSEFRNHAQAICSIAGLSPGQYHYGQVMLTHKIYGAYGHKQREQGLETLALVGFWPMRWTIQLAQSFSVVLDFWPSREAFSVDYDSLNKEQVLEVFDSPSEMHVLQKARDALSQIDFSVSLRNLSHVYVTIYDNKKRHGQRQCYSGGGQMSYVSNYLLTENPVTQDGDVINVCRSPDGEFLPLGQANLELAIDDLLNDTGKIDLVDGYKIEANIRILKSLLKREEAALKVYEQLEKKRKGT